MTVREHHFEVVVTVEDGKPCSAYINAEESAHWPAGTVYDITDGDGEWISASEAWDDDLAAGDYLGEVLQKGQETCDSTSTPSPPI